jgi:hypothetical protein
MMPTYSFNPLSEQVVLITWVKNPSLDEAQSFITDLKTLLDNSPKPLYFISELSRGRIVDIRIIQQLGALTQHAHWSGSSAFTKSIISQIFVGQFQKSHPNIPERNQIFDQAQEAIDFLEALSPGLTTGIDWATAFNKKP